MNKIEPKESQSVEYKRIWQDKYLEWICGFANAQGAVMYFGVDDDHEVVGLKNVDRLMEDIPNKIVTTMGIVVDVNLHELNGLEYIEVVVEPSNIPINYKGKYYYRSGSTMQELRGPALQQFVLKKMGRSWDDVVNNRATIDDLDKTAIEYFLRKGYENGRITDEERNMPIEMLLENLDLIDEEGKLKNAALLLFAKKPQRYFTSVRFNIGRFSGSESNLITQDVIEGNIIQMADRVVEVLKSKYLTMPITFKGMNRIEKLEVPEDALREILYNAIVHKDYTGAHIQMRVWDDRCEVWNEGELPVGYTPETLLERHSSRPRNRNIANAFFKAGFIDAWGRGYKKICEGFDAAGLPIPKIETADGGVRVTFQRNNVNNVLTGGQTSSQTGGQTSSQTTVDIVFDLIRQNPRITKSDIAKATGISKSYIQQCINRLKKENKILRKGSPTYGGIWEIIQEEKK
ncbi:MAG: putative DNA binding domain-containing protein [Bacteroidaceae bacterium]|nr:putative DNA binding domain-containing protein [Bacteroidaceae bacterium]